MKSEEDVRLLVSEFIGATIYGALHTGRTPDGYDGARKEDVIELAGEVAQLLNDGWTLTPPKSANEH